MNKPFDIYTHNVCGEGNGDIPSWMCYAKARLLDGKGYRPRFRVRLPEWAAAGQRVLDVRSAFLAVNMTPSQRAYARELAIERRAR